MANFDYEAAVYAEECQVLADTIAKACRDFSIDDVRMRDQLIAAAIVTAAQMLDGTETLDVIKAAGVVDRISFIIKSRWRV